MDIGTILGLTLASAAMLSALLLDENFPQPEYTWIIPESLKQLRPFFHLPSVATVAGGTLAAVLISFPLSKFLSVFSVVKICFFNRSENVPKVIEQLVSLAEVARREGLLALESKLDDVDQPFVQLGVQLAIDGSPPEVIEDLLRTEINAVAKRHAEGKSVVDQAGRFAPAFGMVGTLIGLVLMLKDLDDPTRIGPGMAVALITTLYGAVISNAFFLPMAEKLAFLNKQELMAKEIILRGILAIQSGENPRIIDQKLKTFLPPKSRPIEAA